jgi:hypothetical protein
MWTRVDDIDGTEAQQVTFGLDGTAYVIDLGDIEHEKLRGVLRRFIDVAQSYGEMPVPPAQEEQPQKPEGRPGPRTQARRNTAARGSRTSTKTAEPKRSLRKATAAAQAPSATVTQLEGRRVRKAKDGGTPHAVIRLWAGEHGYQVQPKGRIPDEVVAAYNEANTKKK